MSTAEWIKDILKREHFSGFSYVVNGFRYMILGILVGVSITMFIYHDHAKVQNFKCLSVDNSQKDLIQEQCFDEYLRRYNEHFPILGFPLLELLFIGIVGPIYSLSVKKRVRSLDNEDEEQPRFIGNADRRGLFWTYFCQLLVRISFEIIFLILQTQIPSYSPPNFTCHLPNPYKTKQMNVTNDMPRNSTGIVYKCFNSGEEKSALFMDVVCTSNGIFAALAFIEILYISVKAIFDRNFMKDEEFFQTYLKYACSLGGNSFNEYIAKMKKKIKDETRNYKPIVPNIADQFGRTNLLELDSTYTDLIIYLGRMKHEFSEDREEEINRYTRIRKEYVRITKLEDIFTPNEDTQSPLNIMIVGSPGIGKSFFCQKLLRSWAKEELFNKANRTDTRVFNIVYFYKFRNFNSNEKLNLQQLLSRCQFSGPLPNEVYRWVLKHPEKVLLIFDGLDEFRNRSDIEKEEDFENGVTETIPFSALYGKLIKGKLLEGATIVTTSRSTALSCVENIHREGYKRTMELSGFTNDAIKEYVEKFFCQKKEVKQKIWDHIRMNASLLSLCYVPLTCHIVCMSLQERLNSEQENHSRRLPSTFTEIYEDAVKLIIFEHNPKRRHQISNETLEASLKKVSKLALKGIEEERLIFESNEVDKGEDDTNLLHQLPDKKVYLGLVTQFCFLHLTIQEFLAAKEIVSTRKGDRQSLKDWVANHVHQENWQLVIQFVAGLLRHEDDSMVEIFTDLLPESFDEADGVIWWPQHHHKKLVLILSKCLFEIPKPLKNVLSKTFIGQKGSIAVRLQWNRLHDGDVTALVNVLHQLKSNIHTLDVMFNFIGPEGCLEISKLIRGSTMRNYEDPIESQSLRDFSQALHTDECKLATLGICDNEIGDFGLKHLSDALSTNECKLTTLNISGNEIGADGVKHLSDALATNNCKLTTLYISGNGIGDFGLKHLSDALYTNECKLTTLDISRNGTGADGVKHLSDALATNNCKLTTLDISVNEIGADGVKHLSAALSTNECKLTTLDISENEIGDDGVKHLSDALATKKCKLII